MCVCVCVQCRTVKITILGDEGVPIQVDGEAWIQPPGVIKIQHKNRAQMLTRDRVRLTQGGRAGGSWGGVQGFDKGGVQWNVGSYREQRSEAANG